MSRFPFRRKARLMVADVGASHVAIGEFGRDAGNAPMLQRLGFKAWSDDLADAARWQEKVAEAFAALAVEGGTGEFSLVVPPHLAFLKSVKTPAIAKSRRGRIIQFEAGQAIPYPLHDVAWDYSMVTENARELEVMLVAAKTDAMRALVNAAEAAGFLVRRALPSCMALLHGFRFNHPEVDEPVLLTAVGARSAQFLFVGRDRYLVRTVFVAGNFLTQAIAEERGLDFAAAEALKLGALSGRSDERDGALVMRAVAKFQAQLLVEMTRSMAAALRQDAAMTPRQIYLCGGGSLVGSLPQACAQKFGLPVHRYEPWRRVGSVPDVGGDVGSRLAELAGAASCADPRARVPNLLPLDIVTSRCVRRRHRIGLAAAAVLALGFALSIAITRQAVAETTTQVDEIETRLAPARVEAVRERQMREELDERNKRIAVLRGIMNRKSNWAAFLQDVQERLAAVEDGWLTSMTVAPATGPDATEAGLSLVFSGNLLDGGVDDTARERVKWLLASVAESPFVASIHGESFDPGRRGLLQFKFTLVTNLEKPL